MRRHHLLDADARTDWVLRIHLYEKAHRHTGGMAKTPFPAKVDEETCTLCGKCIKVCNTACIDPVKAEKTTHVDENVCLGCGACIESCPENALQLVERDKRPRPPLSKVLG